MKPGDIVMSREDLLVCESITSMMSLAENYAMTWYAAGRGSVVAIDLSHGPTTFVKRHGPASVRYHIDCP